MALDFVLTAKRLLLGRGVRRARLYGVGMGKSGTHSIAAMFLKPVRAGHEPEALPLIERILARKEGALGESDFHGWLRERDCRMGLEVDSSNLNAHILDFLVNEFPEARFVLTIRDCYSWCDSMMNHSVRFAEATDPLWGRLRDWLFRPDMFSHAPEEHLLKTAGLYTLEGYFSRWRAHNEGVIQSVPPERLLVVRTDQIQKRTLEIADFARFPRRTVLAERAHGFRNPEKKPLLKQIDHGFVEAAADKHCKQLMSRFFPEITSLADAPL